MSSIRPKGTVLPLGAGAGGEPGKAVRPKACKEDQLFIGQHRGVQHAVERVCPTQDSMLYTAKNRHFTVRSTGSGRGGRA